MSGWGKFHKFIASLLYPVCCPYCGRVIAADKELCAACDGKLPRIEDPICRVCGQGLAFCFCRKKYRFYRCVTPFYYEGPAKTGMRRFKFQGKSEAAQPFAGEMANVIEEKIGFSIIDVIVCVPMTKAAVSRRGYNQSELLAVELSKISGVKYEPGGLVKEVEHMSQHMVGYHERWSNVIGAFGVLNAEAVKNKNVLLVDDVMTTGATLNECASALKFAGAKEVFCVVFASTRSRKLVKGLKVSYNTDRNVHLQP